MIVPGQVLVDDAAKELEAGNAFDSGVVKM